LLLQASQTEASPLPPVMVPVSVLKRFDTTPSGESKQVTVGFEYFFPNAVYLK
jgi:hypothetical protein